MPIVAKLDELGKPAWIALMILGFMVWWPVGLATLAFIIGSGRKLERLQCDSLARGGGPNAFGRDLVAPVAIKRQSRLRRLS